MIQALPTLARPREAPPLPRILVPEAVQHRLTGEVCANPEIEVGGKYVGFVDGDARHGSLAERRRAMAGLTFRVSTYIEAGPRATRTPTYHLGDREYQERRFRELERRHPELEHLGTWHSHRPNGLSTLSQGDVEGYTTTVNDPDHNHDYFLATLAVDDGGFETARHFLFVRGDRRYYELPNERVETDREAEAGADREPGPAEAEAPPEGGGRWPDVPGWTDHDEGRAVIQRDGRLLERRYPELRRGVREGRLIVLGTLHRRRGLAVDVRFVYPSQVGGGDGLLKVVFGQGATQAEVTGRGALAADLARTCEFVEFVALAVDGELPLAGEARRRDLGLVLAAILLRLARGLGAGAVRLSRVSP